AAQKKADKEAKALAKKQAKEAKMTQTTGTTATHMNKNGTPDKRFKTNKETKTSMPAQNQAQSTAPISTINNTATVKEPRNNSHVARSNSARTPDKVISTDAAGRTIYQGPRGGKYYITKNGNKEYVK
ncbi:MAG: hypothetical protein ABI784_02505, partial [Ginsengibacter sp.]